MGQLTFSADSLHIYERDVDKIVKMIDFFGQSIQQDAFVK